MSFDRFAHEAKAPPLRGDMKAAYEYHRAAVLNQDADEVREQWKEQALKRTVSAPKEFADLWQDVASPRLDMDILPVGSWFLQLRFRLRTPYLSRDEELFHVIDNPVRSEPLWGLPFVAPTSWKGLLRDAVRSTNDFSDDGTTMRRLFGNPRAAEENFQQGRLRFFPAFFDRKGLEIINPHDRARRVGKNPILMECVPVGAEGIFTLLYLPFDNAGQRTDVDVCCGDLCIVASVLPVLFTGSGFSAKTSSGYGLAEDGFVRNQNVVRLKVGYQKINAEKISFFSTVKEVAERLCKQALDAQRGGP